MDKRKNRTRSAVVELSAEEKERIYREIDEAPPGKIWSQSKPLTAAERRHFERVKKKRGRAKTGKAARVVPISVERALCADTVKILRERIRAADSGEPGLPAKKVLSDIRRRIGGTH